MKVLLFYTYVFTCPGCGKWMGRYPQYDGDEWGKGYSCPGCGITSIKYRPGRPVGPRSKLWGEYMKFWKQYGDVVLEDPWGWETIKYQLSRCECGGRPQAHFNRLDEISEEWFIQCPDCLISTAPWMWSEGRAAMAWEDGERKMEWETRF